MIRQSVRSRGFTLIEVLVALAIVVIGMAAVLEALNSSANTVFYMRDKTFAEWVGLNQVANVRLQMQQQQLPATGNTTGEIDFAGRSWHWRQEVTETQIKGMVRIEVKVRPADVKAGEDDGWFTSVSGMAGDAVATPVGTTPLWGSGSQGPGGANGGDANGLGGTATPAPTTGPTTAPTTSPNPQNPTPPVVAPRTGPGTLQ